MPRTVDLKVGFTCNNNCIHCVVSDKRNEPDLSLQGIESLIESYIARYSEIGLVLTGGEITFRDDFGDIMRLVQTKKAEGLIRYVELQTNGRMLSHDKVLEATTDVVDCYLIALHSSNPAVHDSITSRPGSFRETACALSKLKQRIDLRSIAVQTVISKRNYAGLLDLYRFIHKQYGIFECNITFPHPLGSAYSTEITPSYSEIRDNVNRALQFCLNHGMGPHLEALPICVFEDELREYASETYKRQDEDVVGYGGEKDGHVDYKKTIDASHAKYTSCGECAYDDICVGVWREYKSLYPDDDMLHLINKPAAKYSMGQ